MSLFLGKPEYSPIKDFAEIQGDMSVANSLIVITEGKIIKIDSGYAFCLIAKSIGNLSKADSYKPDTPVVFVAHTKEYTRWTRDNPRTPTQPTALENTLALWLESEGAEWLNKPFKGSLHLHGAESVLEAVKTKNLWHIMIDFQECEPSIIKEDSLKATTKAGGYAKATQSEGQRLIERQAFVIAATGSYGEGSKDLLELSIALTAMKKEIPETYEIFVPLLKLILGNAS